MSWEEEVAATVLRRQHELAELKAQAKRDRRINVIGLTVFVVLCLFIIWWSNHLIEMW